MKYTIDPARFDATATPGAPEEWDSRAWAESMIAAAIVMAQTVNGMENRDEEAAAVIGTTGRDMAVTMLETMVDELLGHAASGRLLPKGSRPKAAPPSDDGEPIQDSFSARARADGYEAPKQESSADRAHERMMYRLSGGWMGRK